MMPYSRLMTLETPEHYENIFNEMGRTQMPFSVDVPFALPVTWFLLLVGEALDKCVNAGFPEKAAAEKILLNTTIDTMVAIDKLDYLFGSAHKYTPMQATKTMLLQEKETFKDKGHRDWERLADALAKARDSIGDLKVQARWACSPDRLVIRMGANDDGKCQEYFLTAHKTGNYMDTPVFFSMEDVELVLRAASVDADTVTIEKSCMREPDMHKLSVALLDHWGSVESRPRRF